LRQLELRCTIVGQVAEVCTSLAAIDLWLWLRERVKPAKLVWMELAQTELVQAKLVWMEQLAGV
jgi:hypothetical protein